MNKRIILVLITILVVLSAGLGIYFYKNSNDNDAKKFAKEYTKVTSNNVFTYRTSEEIIKILEHGTGVVYLGFPTCPWCQQYVTYLNEVAKNSFIDKIYYLNIYEDRKNNTEDYQKIVSLLSKYLGYDNEGNKRIYVPAVITVNKGEIVGFDDETSYDTKGYDNPEEYWANEDLEGLKRRLASMFEIIKPTYCTTECNA